MIPREIWRYIVIHGEIRRYGVRVPGLDRGVGAVALNKELHELGKAGDLGHLDADLDEAGHVDLVVPPADPSPAPPSR